MCSFWIGEHLAGGRGEHMDAWTQEDIDGTVVKSLGVEAASKLGWYDGLTHRSMFAVPKPVRAALAAETRVVTMDTPLAFMAGEGVRELSGAAAAKL